ncbi:ArnT family glycosyltransferase [Bryobacter aggregatus]|uniref:ArnT family glycosyltransferase n=1 Tax=Bryobacter aggregatus TaxID=360054 RepID=UPI00138E52D4|nr:hypothetical protein [Bryobacter aggregatus]
MWQFIVLSLLRFSLNSNSFLLMEEAGSSFLDVLYFENRLQVCQVTTNIASYLVFWLGLQAIPDPGIFYGRLVKSVVMAGIPALVYLILHRRLQLNWIFAALAAVVVGLLPGVFYYSVLALDMAMDVPFGLLAIYLAFGTTAWSAIGAGFFLSFAALSYGSGLAFVFPVAYLLWRRPQRWQSLSVAACSGLALVLASIFYWTNTQVLFLGGGSGGSSLWNGARGLYFELTRSGYSYYFTMPAMSALGYFPIGFLGLLGGIYGVARFRRYGVWVLLAIGSAGIGIASGLPFGVRRSIPLVLSLGVLGCGLVWELLQRLEVRRLSILTAILFLGILLGGMLQVAMRWQHGDWIRADYAFPFTQASLDASIEDYRLRLVPVPKAEPKFGIRMTYAILGLLTPQDPLVRLDEVHAAPDTMDAGMPLFPRDAARFSLWREQWKRLRTPSYSPQSSTSLRP